MIIFLRDRDGLKQRAVTCYSYEYYNDNNHDSSFDVAGIYSSTYEGGTYEGGYVIVLDPPVGYPHVSLIDTVTPADRGEPHTQIKTKPLIGIFDRHVKWKDEYTNSTYATVLADIFQSEFGTGQSDPLYKCSWLSCSVTSSSIVDIPENLDDASMFNLKEWVDKLEERLYLVLRSYPTTTGATITDSISTSASSTVIFDETRFILDTETYSSDRAGKITVHSNEDDTWTSTDYYLKTDGTVSTTKPVDSDRVRGVWKHLINQTEADVNKEFNQNKYEHKIKFLAKDWVKNSGEKVTVMTKDERVFESVVRCVRVSDSQGELIDYELGNLPTTLLEVVEEVEEDTKASSSSKNSKSGSGGGSEYGKRELIWQTINYKNEFSKDTVINENDRGWIAGKKISNYSYFIIFVIADTTRSSLNYCTGMNNIIDPNGGLMNNLLDGYIETYGSRTRQVSVDSSGFHFSAVYDSNIGTRECVPYRIYGIK